MTFLKHRAEHITYATKSRRKRDHTKIQVEQQYIKVKKHLKHQYIRIKGTINSVISVSICLYV